MQFLQPPGASQNTEWRWLMNVPRRLQTVEDSLSDEVGGETYGKSTIDFHWLPDPGFLIEGFLI